MNLRHLIPTPLPDPLPQLYATRRPDAASAIKKANGRGIVVNGPEDIRECLALLDQHVHTYSE